MFHGKTIVVDSAQPAELYVVELNPSIVVTKRLRFYHSISLVGL